MSQKGFMARNPLRSAGDDMMAQSLPYGGTAATASSIGTVNYFRHHTFD